MARNNGENLIWFFVGASLGAAVALLYAPQAGDRTRRLIVRKLSDGRDKLADSAIEDADAYARAWGRVSPVERAEMAMRAAALIRERKFEFDAWLVTEAGKTWPEAEADVSEAIDFCEYYARQMVRYASPDPLVQLPGEHDELVYLPLGAGVIIPPWNFPLAILTGMTIAALVAGKTVVLKPSSETPTIAAKFAEVLRDAGFPPRSFALST